MSDAAATSSRSRRARLAGVGSASMWVAAGTALSRITGFLRVFVLVYAVGQSDLADVYSIANTAPNLVYEFVVGGVLSATLVPLFVKAKERNDSDSASVLMSVGLVASLVLTLLAMGLTFGAHQWVEGQRANYEGEVSSWELVEIGVSFLYLFLPQILFYAITALTTAYLNANRRFRTAAFAPVLTNVVSIAAFIIVGLRLQGRDDILDGTIYDVSTIYWLGIGTTAGIVAMTIPLLWEMRRLDTPLQFLPKFRDPIVGQLIRLSGWTFGYVAANQVALFFVMVSVDGYARYSNAFIFFQLPHGLIAVSLMTTVTPELARAVANADYQALADRFVRGIRLLNVLVMPAAIGYALLAVPIASFLARGSLSAEDAAATGRTLAAFAIGLPAFSTFLFVCRGFYAMSNTRTPFFLNLIENAFNIGFIVLFAIFGFATTAMFALAYSLAYVVGAAIALRTFERAVRRAEASVLRPDLTPLLHMFIAALVMGAAVWLSRQVFSADQGLGAIVAVVVGVLVGVCTYGAVAYKLQVPEVVAALRTARTKLNI